MAIEIRELVIKVKIEEPLNRASDQVDIQALKQTLLRQCKKEIKRELNRKMER